MIPFTNHGTILTGGRTEETNRCNSLHWCSSKTQQVVQVVGLNLIILVFMHHLLLDYLPF